MAKLKLYKEADLRKKYKGIAANAATIISEQDHTLRIPSRSLWLNWQLGGGILYGKIVEIFGYESTGKSLMALDFGYVTQQLGGILLWADAESAFDYRWARKNGIDTDRVEVYEGNDLEGISDWLRDMSLYYRSILKNNEPILVVCDSIAALLLADDVEGDMQAQKGSFKMGKAKLLNEFYPKRLTFFKKYGVTLIMINQVREKIGATMYELATKTTGGASTAFYASIRIALNRSTAVKGITKKDGSFREDKEKGTKVGQNVFVDIFKNKTYPVMGKIKTQVYFKVSKTDYVGYSKYYGLLPILESMNLIEKKGKNIKYLGETVAEGEENFYKELHTNDELRASIIKKSKVNTISKTRKQLEALTKNHYPVKLKADGEE